MKSLSCPRGRRWRPALAGSALLALLAAVPATAGADTCVNPRGTKGCYASIQEAIDNTRLGETVVISPGRYRQTFVVYNAKNVRGGGTRPTAVVIDGGGTPGSAVTVNSPETTLSNFAVVNAGTLVDIRRWGIVAKKGVRLSGLVLRGAQGSCVNDISRKTRIERSRISLCGEDGIFSEGYSFTVADSRVSGAYNRCISVVGVTTRPEKAPRILGNTTQLCGRGIVVENGHSPLVRGNRVLSTRYSGIEVRSDIATVEDNVVDVAGDRGIFVDDTAPLVVGNRVSNTLWQAFEVRCLSPDSCWNGLVAGNEARTGNHVGFQIDFPDHHPGSVDEGTFELRNNTARDFRFQGFDLSGSAKYTLRGNSATGCREGYYLSADLGRSLLTENVASSSGERGFVVQCDDAVLRANTARYGLVGFHVLPDAAGAILRKNAASANSFHACDQGSGTTLAGNSFAATACPP